jgi:hypothetical protein
MSIAKIPSIQYAKAYIYSVVFGFPSVAPHNSWRRIRLTAGAIRSLARWIGDEEFGNYFGAIFVDWTERIGNCRQKAFGGYLGYCHMSM